MTDTPRIGFIGTGRMATALARGFLAADVVQADSLIGYDVSPEAAEQFRQVTQAHLADNVTELLQRSDLILLAVKPQYIVEVLKNAAREITARHLVVSIAAGVPLPQMADVLGSDARLIRVMPNTPCLVGAGASGFSLGAHVTREDAATMQRLLSTVGLAVEVPEHLLDAITGLSGSGPAYGFQIIEALSDGAVRAGLPREMATRLAAQTLLGAARMVLETGEHPGALKDAVTSPGGTTIAGIHALETGGLRACLMNAVQAATMRARELGQ